MPVDTTQVISHCHSCCCDCITKLQGIRDKCPADAQKVIDDCVAACRDCCTECCTAVSSLAPAP